MANSPVQIEPHAREMGGRLRMAREAAGLDQAALALRSGVPLEQIVAIEAGAADDGTFTLDLAGALDISALWLSFDIGTMTQLRKE